MKSFTVVGREAFDISLVCYDCGTQIDIAGWPTLWSLKDYAREHLEECGK
jgi:hypothetical protein